MERRISLFISRRNAFTWIACVLLLASAVLRITLECINGVPCEHLWIGIVLPVAASLLYLLIVLLNGKEMFYKTTIPVWMMGIYYGFQVALFNFGFMVNALFWVALLFYAILYTDITSSRGRWAGWLFLLNAAPMAALAYLHRSDLVAGNWSALLILLPDVLMCLGLMITVFALRIHPVGEYHPTWGDRCDGRKIRTLAPMAQITAFFQVERNTCSNLFDFSCEISHIDRYIRQKRKEGYTDFGITHVLLAAYVRGVAKYPQLNRFISGQKVYSRGNDIQYCMVIKKDMTLESPDTSIKVHLTPYDTSIDIYHKLKAAVDDVKRTMELDSGIDHLIMYLNLIPSVVLKFVVWLLKLLDYFGLLPKFLLELSPCHGSLFFTSMGSLGIPPIYHHLYDFGNLPAFGAFGCKRKALEVQEDGSVVQKKYIDMKFTLDERITDGYYYATFFKYFRRLLAHPEVLDNPPEEVVKDID